MSDQSGQMWSRRRALQSSALLGLGAWLPGMAEPRWREAASLPVRVQEIYPCLHDGDLWVAGGLGPDAPSSQEGISDRVLRFGVEQNSWQEAPGLPEPRHHGFLVSVGGGLLLFGGFIAANGGRWSASLEVLRLAGGGWVRAGALQSAQCETVTAVANGRVHLAGGRAPTGGSNADWNDQGDVDTHQVFDPATAEIATAAPLPMARNRAASFVIGNRWHVVGGRTVNSGNSARHDVYDFTDRRWMDAAPMPQAQGGLAAASIGSHGYVFGGEYFSASGGGVYSEVWDYDANADRWRDAGTMPVPRHGLGAVAIGGEIYVVAGATQAGGNGTSDRLSVFTP